MYKRQIYDAAKGYFGKQPSELSDYEAIMLAGLPNAPSAYSPSTNPELAYSRMKIVLSKMVECNAITQEVVSYTHLDVYKRQP